MTSFSDKDSDINIRNGGKLSNQNIHNVSNFCYIPHVSTNSCNNNVPIKLAPGQSYNLPPGYVVSNYRNYIIQNDYPVISNGVWNAILDTATGETIYTSNGAFLHGPVNMIHGILNIKSGATVSGIYQLANMSGFGGNANPTINVENGGKLENSHIFNGFVNIENGGVSENNEYVSEVVNIENGGKSDNDYFLDPGDTAERGGTLINPHLPGRRTISSFRTSDSTAKVVVANGGTIHNPHIANTGHCYFPVTIPSDNGCNNSSGNNCSRTVLKGETVSNQTISSSCSLSVYGKAYNTIINGGSLYTYSESTVTGVTANSGIINAFGGALSDITVNNTASALFTNTDTAVTNLKLNNASATITNSATARDTIINDGSQEYISAGAVDYDARILYGGKQFIIGTVNHFTYAEGTTIYAGAEQTVYDWGRTENVILSGGTINVSAGGGINGNVHFLTGGIINVYSGAGVSTTINNNGKEYIYNGGWTDNTIVDNGFQYVMSGGVVNSTTLNDNGITTVYSNATANNITVNNGGEVRVSGGTVDTASINNNGIIDVNGGTINNATVEYGGILNIVNGNIGNTHITVGGALLISSDQVNVLGQIYLQKGGFLNNRKVLRDTIINNLTKESLTALFNDPTLFAPINSTTGINTNTDKNITTPVNTNTDKNTTIIHGWDELNDLLNNPEYFEQEQNPLLRTSDSSSLPTVDNDGNPIKWLNSSIEENNLDIRSYRITNRSNISQEAEFYSFLPQGSTSRVWGIKELWNGDDQNVFDNGLGGVLVYGNVQNYTDSGTYKAHIYIADTAKLIVNNPDSVIPAATVYKSSILQATDGQIGDLTVDGGTATFSKDAKLTKTLTLIDGGTATIEAKSVIAKATVNNSSILQATGGQIGDLSVNDGGTATIEAKSVIAKATVNKNSILQATGGQIGDLTVNDGGTATFSKDAKLTGTLTLTDGGRATIETETGGIIDLQGTKNSGLIISGKASKSGTIVESTIDNFDGNDNITLKDVQRSDVAGVKFEDEDHVTITLKDGSFITLHIKNIQTTGYKLGENPDGSLIFETCFLAGTLISTFNSTMTVESIKVGDVIKTFNWKTNQTIDSTVIWVGQKHTNVKTYLSDDLAGYPVRILKNAISENVPNKDLLVTPEHCLFFDGNFVPARMLVNRRSIYYDYSITSYDYYHIETEQHSVIWANGMLTESYLDTGNRNTFKNDQKVVSLFNNIKTWDNDAAAPLNVHRDFVEPIYNQINKRALDINFELQTEHFVLTSDPNLYLTTKLGTIIQPHACNNGRYIFNIPEGIDKVNLISRTGRPCETIGSFIDDRRELGVLVGNVFIINKNDIHEITDHLSNPDLTGWDVIEQSPCRWTKGKATLNIHTTQSEKSVLIVNILTAGPYLLDEKKELYKKII